MKNRILLLLKGMAMGAADIVPGVSGGTIAFISGIYEELISALNSFDKTAILLLFKGRIKDLWTHVNGAFLVNLFLGIFISLGSLVFLISYLLEQHKELLWSFFFGLIVASAAVILPSIRKWRLSVFVSLAIGIVIAFYITIAAPAETSVELWFIFLAGAIAICAMILPGISGSFILLLMGKYEYILASVKEFALPVILTFGAGCVAGLLLFSKLLKYLLTNFHDVFVALLTGFMIGSLNKVWPWKADDPDYIHIDRHGEEIAIVQHNVTPGQYEGDPYLVGCIILSIAGFFFVYLLHKYAVKTDKQEF